MQSVEDKFIVVSWQSQLPSGVIAVPAQQADFAARRSSRDLAHFESRVPHGVQYEKMWSSSVVV